jgi:DNA mismatch repair protein MutS
LGYLRQSLINIHKIKALLHPHADVLAWLEPLFDLEELIKFLQNHLNEELPVSIAKGNVIKEVSEELDRLRNLQSKGRGFLDEMCQREIERTGITSLKIDFNNVFGYYIEVRNTHKDKVPDDWVESRPCKCRKIHYRRIKEYENQILGAEEKIGVLETTVQNVCWKRWFILTRFREIPILLPSLMLLPDYLNLLFLKVIQTCFE